MAGGFFSRLILQPLVGFISQAPVDGGYDNPAYDYKQLFYIAKIESTQAKAVTKLPLS